MRYQLLPFFLFFASPFPSLLEAVSEISVISKIPHQLPAYTQGLAFENDRLYESTGLYKHSSLRILDPITGKIVHHHPLAQDLFAEGIAVFDDSIIQLTWKNQTALVYTLFEHKLKHTLSYKGEGWGLCRDGNTVWMSNGTATLLQRDALTFQPIRSIIVHRENIPVAFLNDLECVENELFANVWLTNYILRINKSTGEVIDTIDASALLTPSEQAKLGKEDVLNGIAFCKKTNSFYITGKEWPWIFEVRFK